MWQLVTGTLITALIACAPARSAPPNQSTIEIPKIQVARSVSAIVMDEQEKRLEGAVVEETTPDGTEVIRTTKTDKSGVFVLDPVKGRKIYYLRIRSYGFHRMQFKLKVNRIFGRTVKMKMLVA